jgi:hypothetical protein
MKCGLNKINIKLFTQQMGWLGGKRIELHPWGPRIKLHKWHSLTIVVNNKILTKYSLAT